MNRKNKIYLLASVMALLILTACSGAEEKETGWYYESGKYKIVSNIICNERNIPDSLDQREDSIRYYWYDRKKEYPYGAVVKGRVDGASINRVIEPEDHTSSYANYVLTPVIIDEIIYAGEKVKLEEDCTYLVREPFFYIDRSAEYYYDLYGDDTVFAYNYVPMQRGRQYLMYLHIYEGEEKDADKYNGETYLYTMGRQEAVYCLESEEVARELVSKDDFDFNYWKLWREVQEHYNDNFGND